MTSLFFVYLFDYYVNQDIKLLPRAKSPELQTSKRVSSLNFIFSFGEKIYKSIPILQFHIGEQYLLITLFLIFNQVKSLFYLVIFLGIFYSIYWPITQYFDRKPA